VKQLMSCLNTRGVRERSLNKALEKHVDYICQLYNKPKKNGNLHYVFSLRFIDVLQTLEK
jgi:hypothetical protein